MHDLRAPIWSHCFASHGCSYDGEDPKSHFSKDHLHPLRIAPSSKKMVPESPLLRHRQLYPIPDLPDKPLSADEEQQNVSEYWGWLYRASTPLPTPDPSVFFPGLPTLSRFGSQALPP